MMRPYWPFFLDFVAKPSAKRGSGSRSRECRRGNVFAFAACPSGGRFLVYQRTDLGFVRDTQVG